MKEKQKPRLTVTFNENQMRRIASAIGIDFDRMKAKHVKAWIHSLDAGFPEDYERGNPEWLANRDETTS